MVIPGRVFAEAGDLDPLAERIPQENLEKSAHGPAKSRRPRLSTVGQDSSAGRGVSKAIWTHTAVGSPGLSDTRQTWPTSIGLPPNRPNMRNGDQFSPQSTGSDAPPVGVWKTTK